VQKKNPHRFFLATRHQGCVLLKWYFDRQCNTYFTQNRFLYNCPRLVLFRSWALGRETGVCWETEKYIPCMWLWNFRPQTTKSPGLDTTVLWPNETPTPQRALCFVWFALKLWCQLLANQRWKKHYDLKRKTKSGLLKKLKNSRGHTWVPFVTTIHYYVTPYDTLSLFRENSFSDKLFISIESQKTSMYIGRYCIPNQSLSLKTWIQVADNVFVV